MRMNLTPTYEVGDTHGNFTVTKVLPIEELQVILYELRHTQTGAEVMYLANDDHENLFCISFQTLPTDSTGVAHILEHTVLCGSKKYPVKDPFFSMARTRSRTSGSPVPSGMTSALSTALTALWKKSLTKHHLIRASPTLG